MNYPSIRIEGAILSPDILDRIEEVSGQRSADFVLDSSAKVSKKTPQEAAAGLQDILESRRPHQEFDLAIRDAYGWPDFDLVHGFYEVETLTENERLRYTISPGVRKEVLKLLLALNHQRAATESTSTSTPTKTKRGRKPKTDDRQGSLF